MMWPLAMLIAMALDACIGWPNALFARIGHPVTWLGALINALEKLWNRPDATPPARKLAGVLTALITITIAGGAALMITLALPAGWLGTVLTGILAWPLVATRSMHEHVAAVARPLIAGDLSTARQAVAMIVGRNPSELDEPAVARAALESLAENTSDGIVAPVFWGALLGLPGIAAYKAINTLDSMIGHRTPRHEAFGWASARIDDVVNLIPARLTGLLFAAASARPVTALKSMWRDAHQHRSPNAGWPESAMAGALRVRLSGPRVYDGHVADEPWVNAPMPDPTPSDLKRGLALYVRAMLALCTLLALFALI
ncbi:adenosylcobinamide-phosphate synthase CbiB [Actibacterium lipolyticum]|uniref:Cobalamin biosynthesis protein CobD n=1 Tax=Actibacterium lipolyticum TaxID=1524263 RepID=A0A238JYF7_9RHOB|nr:adenosylcobinamide-phosphate synthase CbiB [Actibacterium lipolyticum]SMX34872.1 cobalamin biosynthesis protein [Actibacterium lipolyticum]